MQAAVRKRRWALCFVLCASVPSAAAAETTGQRLSVLQLASDSEHHAVAQALVEDLRRLLKLEFRLRDTPVSLEQLSIAQGCEDSSPSCLQQIARKLEVDGLVYGELTVEQGSDRVGLHHFDAASGAVKTSAWATLPQLHPSPEQIRDTAHELIARMFEGEHPRLAAEQAEPPPASVPPPAPRPALQPRAASESAGLTGREIAGYSLLGGAALSSGLAIFSFVQIDRAQDNSTFQDYRRSVGQMRPEVRDVCDEVAGGRNYGLNAIAFQQVKDNCAAGRTFEVLQYVFIGGAVLAAGVSVYLLLAPPIESVRLGAAELRVQPRVGPHGASLDARLKF